MDSRINCRQIAQSLTLSDLPLNNPQNLLLFGYCQFLKSLPFPDILLRKNLIIQPAGIDLHVEVGASDSSLTLYSNNEIKVIFFINDFKCSLWIGCHPQFGLFD